MRTKTAVPTEDILLTTLQDVWQDVCCPFDVIVSMPEPAVLFDAAPLDHPHEAAEQVMVNMLLEVMECVDRFSPWYTRPARDFGLTTVLDEITCRVDWGLTGKGADRWRAQLDDLSAVIRKYSSLIEAMLLVDGLITAVTNEDAVVLAQCRCLPCRYIRVKKSILRKTEIICDICHQAFFPTDDYPDYKFQT
ncbi:MAG: hypothetical protein H6667_06910 [Ardenticatenaceae bacterium]|nr:hypothetical protein [Ardenticatenaceae bacterium]MCB9445085.1 hypothetical protein [Ardenticatenaceae bacterium]